MKQNDWTRQMRSRLDQSKAPVPDDLWDKIESRLDAQGIANKPQQESAQTSDKNRRHATLIRFAAWSLSTAAAVTLLITIGYKANKTTITELAANNNAEIGANADTNNGANAIANNVKKNERHDNTLTNANHDKVLIAKTDANADVMTLASASDMETTAPVDDATISDTPQNSRSMQPQTRRSESTRPYRFTATVGNQEPQHDKTTTRWSVGAHTNGTFSDMNNTDYPGQRMLMAAAAQGKYGDNSDNPDTYIFTNNVQLLANYKEVKHHAKPITVGMSVAYALTDRLSLTTGMTYTRAETDFVRSSAGVDITEKQKLHYIGVPLGVKYRVWGNDCIQTYATAGGEANFNVSASVTSNDVKTSTDHDRTQFAVNAAAGVQVNVVKHVGLYAEPGVKYYIDNKSKVETIFKEKPWNFNLQMGIRLDF